MTTFSPALSQHAKTIERIDAGSALPVQPRGGVSRSATSMASILVITPLRATPSRQPASVALPRSLQPSILTRSATSAFLSNDGRPKATVCCGRRRGCAFGIPL